MFFHPSRYHYDAVQYTAFHARKFTAMVVTEDDSRSQLEYELKSRASAQALYRSVTEFHTFFQQDKVSNVIKTSGYCKSVFGSFKGQSPDRFYFDVTRTHQEVVDHLWPILHPNLSRTTRPLPPISSSGTYQDSSAMSVASQRSTRSLPSHSPHHRSVRSQNTLQRSISSDNNFRRSHMPPPFYPPNSSVNSSSSSIRGADTLTRMPHPPSSPFFPYASTIGGNSDMDEQSSYISGGESDTYVCMRSLRGSETYSGAGSDTYVNSGASEVSSTSIENRIPSPPPVYSEVDPNSDIPSPPPRSFQTNNNFTISGILNTNHVMGSHDGVFNFDQHDRVLARTRELESELSRLRNAMTCRMCRTNTIGATFCPCGHTVCCSTCAQKLKQCWECDVSIDSVQKIMLS